MPLARIEPPLSKDILRNTTYSSQAPEGYQSTFRMVSNNIDHMKTDYPEGMHCFTTLPQPITDEVENDGYAECYCTGWFKRKVLSTPGFPSRVVRPRRLVYEIRNVAGRGFGVFATEDIAPGDLIMAERPLLVAMVWTAGYRVPGDNVTQEQLLRGVYIDMEKSTATACARMSPKNLKAYKSLHNSHKTDGSGPFSGIHRTNGFDVEVDDPEGVKLGGPGKGHYSCVGAKASRLNHDCSPNAIHRFNMPAFSMSIYAVRPIAKGEEITVSYTGVTDDSASRQESLKPYEFTCVCLACKDPATSDKERKRVLEGLLPKTSQGVEHADRTLATFEATGLQCHPRYLDLLRRVAQINRKKGKPERAGALDAVADRLAKVMRTKDEAPDPDVMKALGIDMQTFKTPEEVMKFMQSRTGPGTGHHVSVQAVQNLMKTMSVKT